jgi:hypothetical protein
MQDNRSLMIIRRRHTKSFVTLENALVRDRRLSLDEHGMLHYLLSLPDDWEVSRANCARFWDIGKDKAARIFRSLRRCGWAQVERIHGEDGTFLGVRWIITDEPGAEVSEAALDQETDTDDDAPETAPTVAPEHHDMPLPEHGLTMTRVNHGAEKAYHGEYIDSKKTDSEENRLPQNGVRENSLETSEKQPATFTELLKLWPPDHVLSRVAAEQAWQRMGRVARQPAFDAAPRYLDDCRVQSRKVCDLTTYLKEARFERFAAMPGRSATHHSKPGSPQWHRWHDYLKAIGKSVGFMESQAANGVGWTTSQEWPPPAPPRPEGAPSADSTGPPEVLISEQDMADFK